MLAGGGECCADIERLRIEPVLFGDVCSDSTLYRTLRSLDPRTMAAVKEAVAEVRETVWRRSAATKRGPVVLDLDSSLVDIHSREQGADRSHLQGRLRLPSSALLRRRHRGDARCPLASRQCQRQLGGRQPVGARRWGGTATEVDRGGSPCWRRPWRSPPRHRGARRLRRLHRGLRARLSPAQHRLRCGGAVEPPDPGGDLADRDPAAALAAGHHSGRRAAGGSRGG